MYKLDDGQCYPTNCFPAKGLLQPRYEEGAGHWQVARYNEEKAKVEWLFETRLAQQSWQECLRRAQRPRVDKVLTRAQLMKLHPVENPSDLCSVNISHQNFASARENDFLQFDSVAYINATENLLTLEIFRNFPGLRELDLSLNGLRNLKVRTGDFPHLEILDLSYNNLSPEDVRTLGMLPHLKALHLTANGLSSLPRNLATPERDCLKFPALEVLLLDDNHLSDSSVFLSLANLRRLKQLNLDKNGIKEVPYLHYLGHDHFSIHPLSAKSGIRAGLRCRKKTPHKRPQDRSPRQNQKYSYIITQNSQDPDKTEVMFQARPGEETARERSLSPVEDSKIPFSDTSMEFLLPLPELRFLSLANNQIENEEDLLAVAFFPSLMELTFYGNPFTTSRSGDPPLLTSFLQNKLGIKLVRKKVSKLEKPRVFIPIKANREVKSRLPKIRKRPLPAEVSMETTFWQLWTGSDLDPNKRLSWPPAPGSQSFTLSYDADQSILSPLRSDERSACISASSLYNEAFTTLSSLEGLSYEDFGLPPECSLDQIMARKVPSESQPWVTQGPSEDLLPPSRLASRGPSSAHLAPLPEEKSESLPYVKPPSGDPLLKVHLEPMAPPNSPSEERDGSEAAETVGPEEEEGEDRTQSPLSTTSAGDLTQPEPIATSPLEQKGSEPLMASERGEEDLGGPLSPVRSRRSSAGDRDREEPVPVSQPSGEDFGEGDLSSDEGEEEEEEEEEEEREASRLPILQLEGMDLSASSSDERLVGSSGFSFLEDGGKERRGSPLLLVPPSRSISRELYQLIAQVQSYALPPEPEDEAPTAEEMLRRSREGTTEPIFITQVLRVPTPKPQKTRMERLEEILLELRKPKNIVHIPLVCVLRRRKENWREYREALELLKEFQKDYKCTVAVSNEESEHKAVVKDEFPKTNVHSLPKSQSLPEIKAGKKSNKSSAQDLQEGNDSLPSEN
ncbi:X-ray radiation resistance-associated protein 1 isoform X2 [Erythrolamprus reginae]|uniref:X-ray radiation resistance-associated protein 1 isoform X2 n=1 Tax=Erythrolamprus reginae TaxID=121349 RepID=UPI00396CD74B